MVFNKKVVVNMNEQQAPALKLHGFDVSNYYNMLKLAMDLKGIKYDPVLVYPNQTPEFLKISPMGKVPALQTEQGVLVETNIIMEYLDTLVPEKRLFPEDSYGKARVQELVKMVELYLELPARRCHTEAFFGVPVADLTKQEVKRALLNGIQGIARVASFSPYIAGDKISAADIMFLYSADLASAVARKLFDIDLLEQAPGAKALMEMLNELPEVQKIAADRQAATPAFHQYLAKAFAKK